MSQITLQQQRAWADRHPSKEISRLFEQLAAQAGQIHSIVGPYVEIFGKLRDLSVQTTRTDPGASLLDARLLSRLLSDARMTARRVSGEIQIAENEVLGVLEQLEDEGLVSRLGRGRTRAFGLSDKGLEYALRPVLRSFSD